MGRFNQMLRMRRGRRIGAWPIAIVLVFVTSEVAWATSCNNGVAAIIDTANCTVQAGTVPTTVTFAAAPTGQLLLSGASPTGAINATTAGQGNITATASTVLNGGATIGTTAAVGTITVNSGVTLDASAVSTINAGTVMVGAGGGNGVLTLGNTTVTVSGRLDGAGGAGNTILVTGNATIDGIVGSVAGIDTHVDDGASLTVNGSEFRSTATLGSGSGAYGTLILEGNNLFIGAINGNTAGRGALVIDGTVLADSNIGSTNSLASVSIGNGASLTLNNTTLAATNVWIGSAGTLNVGSGAVTAAIDGLSAHTGTVNFTTSNTLQGAIGGSNALAAVNITSGTLTTGSFGIAADSISISSGTTLVTGTGTLNGAIIDAGRLRLGAGSIGSGSLTLSGGILQSLATQSFDVPVSLTGASTIDTNATTLTIAGNISGAGSLSKSGAGTLVLTGTNSYTGGTTVSGGVLQLDSASATGNIVDNAALVFDQASAGSYSGVISGAGGITKQNTGLLTLTGDSSGFTGTTMVTGGTLQVGDAANPGARLGGAVTVWSGGTLSGHGTILGDVSNATGTVAPGGSIGTLSVGGNYDQGGPGILAIALSPSQASQLAVAGSASLAGTLALSANAGSYVVGTRYVIVTAGAGVGGSFAQVTGTTLSPLLDLAVSYSVNEVDLTVHQTGSLASQAQTSNQRSVAQALDGAGQTPALLSTTSALLSQPTTSLIRSGLDQVGGAAEIYADLNSLAIRRDQLVINTVGEQLALSHTTSPDGALLAQGPGALRVQLAFDALPGSVQDPRGTAKRDAWTAWLSGVGLFGGINGGSEAHTLDYSVGGTVMGLDRQVAPDLLLGAYASYTASTFDLVGLSPTGKTDSYGFGAYGSWTHGAFYVDGTLGYAYDDNQVHRMISLSGIAPAAASGSAHANQFLSSLEAGRAFALPDRFTLTPLVGLQAISVDQAQVTESGTGALALAMRGTSENSVRTTLGSRIERDLVVNDTILVHAEAKLVWAHEFADTAGLVNVSFASVPGAAFALTGAHSQRDSALIGLGLASRIDRRLSIFLRYDGDINGSDDSHGVTGGVRVTW